MFSEREALRMRLIQLNDEEQRVRREFERERESIYSRLRTLDYMVVDAPAEEVPVVENEKEEDPVLPIGDNQQGPREPIVESSSPVTTTHSTKNTTKGQGNFVTAVDAIIEVFKSQPNTELKTRDITKKLNERDIKVKNITNAIRSAMKKDDHIKNIDRGLHMYKISNAK